MSDCPNCSRDSWRSIAGCPSIGTPKCPYVAKDYTESQLRRQGAIIIVLGLLYLYVLFEYPFLWLQDEETAFFGVSFRMGALSLAVFVGVLVTCAGYCLFATKKLGIVSFEVGQSWIGWILQPYKIEYRTQIMEDAQRVAPIASDQALPSISRFDELGFQFKSAALLSAVFHLVDLELVELIVLNTYESSGKELDNVVDDSIVILRVKEGASSEGCNEFERKIFEVIEAWPARDKVFNSPLGPRLANLLFIAEQECFFELKHKLHIDDMQRLLQWYDTYRKLFRRVRDELHTDHRGANIHEQETVPLMSRISFRQLRIALVTAILMFFTLGRFGFHVDRVSQVPELWDDLKSNHASRQIQALDAIKAKHRDGHWQATGARWIDALSELAQSSSVTLKFKALQVLALLESGQLQKWYSAYEPQLIEALHDSNEAVKIAALKTFQSFGDLSQSAFSHISRLLQSNASSSVRVEAIRALGALGLEPGIVTPILIEQALGSETSVALAAIEQLGLMGPSAHQSIPELTGLLEDSVLGPPAAKALGKMAPYGKAAIPELQEATREGSAELSYQASKALEALLGSTP